MFLPEEGNEGTHASHLPARDSLFLTDAVHLGTMWNIGLGDNLSLNPFHSEIENLMNMDLIFLKI